MNMKNDQMAWRINGAMIANDRRKNAAGESRGSYSDDDDIIW